MPTWFMVRSDLTLDPTRTWHGDKNNHFKVSLTLSRPPMSLLLGPSSPLRGKKNPKCKDETKHTECIKSNSNSTSHTAGKSNLLTPTRWGGWVSISGGVGNLGPRHLNQPHHATSSIHLTPPWHPLWPCCPCAPSLSPGRAPPSSPRTISILRALCRGWSLHSRILIRLITPRSPQNHRRCRFCAILGWAGRSVSPPVRVAVLIPAFSGTVPIFKSLFGFFFKAGALACSNLEIEEESIPQVMFHTVMDARFFDSRVLYPFWCFPLSTRNAPKQRRINYRVFSFACCAPFWV